MCSDIIEFWSPSRIADRDFVHPVDRNVFDRTRHNFQKDCLPTPFYGPLVTARVVLLFLSLGYTSFDSEHAATPEGQAYYRRQRTGYANLPNQDEHIRVHRWLKKIIKQFETDLARVSDKVAVLNLGAYHSEKFNDHHMLTCLPSSRAALDYAQFVLFPQAEAGERIVVCLRSHRLWGLQRGKRYGRSLFAPTTTASGIMTNEEPMRSEVINTIQKALI